MTTLTQDQLATNAQTWTHIHHVQLLLAQCIEKLLGRALTHDQSKLVDPEVSMFTEFTPKLRDSVYGSDEYKGFLKSMGTALEHHYANARHHPEKFEGGVRGMTLIDLLEMLADWKAAGLRHATGSITRSLEINQKRFGISDELVQILRNTVEYMGWGDGMVPEVKTTQE